MKFTIDTEEKTIYFKEPFTKEDIEYLLSVLDIEGIETWKISMEQSVVNPTYPIGVPNTTPYVPGTGDYYPPPITYYTSSTDLDLTIGEYIYSDTTAINE